MTGNPFAKATKERAKLRLALIGPSGSGKTYTALRIASHLKNGGGVAVVDTERGSASKYADLFAFDTLELASYNPERYIEAIDAAAAAGYAVLILDSLSHAWAGKDGLLEFVDQQTARSQSKNQYTEGWRKATPLHNRMIDAMIQAPLHLIVTMRTKSEYVMERDERGKTVPKKIGLQPVQRDGLEYEFDVVADLDMDNTLIVNKSRCPELTGKVFQKAGEDVAAILDAWLGRGVEPRERVAQKATEPEPVAVKPAGVSNRPYDAETCRAFVRSKSKVWLAENPARRDSWQTAKRDESALQPWTGKQVEQVASLMGKACDGDDQARHAVLNYLLGITTTTQISRQEANAIVALWAADNENGWTTNDFAAAEANAILMAVLVEAGQQALPL
jgi:hypothetical protein